MEAIRRSCDLTHRMSGPQTETAPLYKPKGANYKMQLSIGLQPPVNLANWQNECRKACCRLAISGRRRYMCKTL